MHSSWTRGTSLAVVAVLPLFAVLTFAPFDPGPRVRDIDAQRVLPRSDAFRAAEGYASGRDGLVSFAVIDSSGRLRGHNPDRLYPAASTVKAMLLAAELRRLAGAGLPLDSGTRSILAAMIRFSDNEAADAIYARSGDAGLLAAARQARMTGFTVAGHWGNAQVSAADLAHLFGDLDRALPRRFRDYGRRLLGSVIESQSWGIPVAAGRRFGVRFKGGWLPEKALVHQAAELRERDGRRKLAIAVLTDGQPSFGYGVETVEGIAARLLEPHSALDS